MENVCELRVYRMVRRCLGTPQVEREGGGKIAGQESESKSGTWAVEEGMTPPGQTRGRRLPRCSRPHLAIRIT